MKIKIDKDEIQIFAKKLDKIHKLAIDAHLRVKNNEILLYAQDPANISMINCIIEGEIIKESEEDIFIQITDFVKIMKGIKEDTEIEMKENMFCISTSKRNFQLPIYEKELDKKYFENLPDLEFDVSVSIPIDEMKEAIKDAQSISNGELFFVTMDNNLYLCAEEGIKKATYKFTIDDDINVNLKIKFSLEYINKITDCIFENGVNVNLKQDSPILLKTDSIKFFLAPRVNQND